MKHSAVRISLCLLTVAVLNERASLGAAPDWIAIRSFSGSFAAEFPTEPKEVISQVTPGPWIITVHALSVSQKDGHEFSVIWADYPNQMMAVSPAERVFEGIINGYKTGGKRLISDNPIKIDGHPGHELEVDVGNGVTHHVRFAMAGNRLYQAMTYAPVADKNAPDLAKFMDSFFICDIQDFPTKGFRLEGAASDGWQPTLRDKGKTVAQWLGPGSTAANIASLITIEAGKASGATAEKTARDLAANWGGSVSPQQITLDGDPAFKIESPGKLGILRPVEAFVLTHGGYMYLIIGAQTGGHACEAQLDRIARAWKWEDYADASKHLEFAANPAPLLGGTVTIYYPKDMYFNKIDHPDRILDLSLFDLPNGLEPFGAYVQIVPLRKGAAFEATKDKFLKNLNDGKQAEAPFTWNKRGAAPDRFVTAAVRLHPVKEAPKGGAYIKWAILQLNNESMVLINFTIFPTNEAEKARYDAAADAMVDSLRLNPPRQPPSKE